MSAAWMSHISIPTGKRQPEGFSAGLPQGGIVLVVALLVMASALQTGCTSDEDARRAAQLDRIAKARLAIAATSASVPTPAVVCGPLSASSGQPLAPTPIGQHRVILSWKASVPASSAPTNSIPGYCIYRKELTDAAPGLMSASVLNATTCSDNRVVNGKTYVYELTAINAQGTASTPSKIATAAIPNTQETAPLPPTAAPSCWGDVGANP
jgi:hypothetical protein